MQAILHHLTDFGDTAVTVPLAFLMVGCLAVTAQRQLAIGWALAVLACVATISALKLLLGICGPALIGPSLRSPSGHTAISMLVYGGYAAILGATLKPLAGLILRVGAVLFALGIALSRVALHFHSGPEVLVGLAVGGVALAVAYAVVARYRPNPLPLHWLAAGAAIAFLLFYGERWPAEQTLHRFAVFLDMIRPWCT